MSDRKLEAQLKSLSTKRAGGSPDAQWLLSARETLMMQTGNTVGGAARARSNGFIAFFQIFAPANLGKIAAVPALVLALMVGANLGASAVVAAASHTLPGDMLYDVKLAAENFTLKFTGASSRITRRLDVAARRMDEMVRLSSGVDKDKNQKIERVAALFADTMTVISVDLDKLEAQDAQAALRSAVLVDAKADAFQNLIVDSHLRNRSEFRLAQASLDLASVGALELMVEKRDVAMNVIQDAELTSTVGRGIQRFVTTTESAHEATPIVRKAAEEAKELLVQGEFRAAVRKVVAALNNEEETESASTTETATSTLEVAPEEVVPTVSATGTVE